MAYQNLVPDVSSSRVYSPANFTSFFKKYFLFWRMAPHSNAHLIPMKKGIVRASKGSYFSSSRFMVRNLVRDVSSSRVWSGRFILAEQVFQTWVR